MAFEKVKRQFIIDVVVFGLIIVGVLAYAGFSSMNTNGWVIKGKEEVLVDQDKIVRSNVNIQEGGTLLMKNSDVSIVSGYHGQYGILISGDSMLSMIDSTITCSDFPCYLVAGADEEGKSPRIDIRGSGIRDDTRFTIGNRTRLYSENSSLGYLLIQDDAKASIISSSVYPVLYSSENEVFEGLDAGESMTKDILANAGWELSMKNCAVGGYRLELYEDDDVVVRDSDNVSLSLHSPGNLDGPSNLDLGFVGMRNSGSLDDLRLSFTWTDSVIESVLLFVSGTDTISVTGGVLEDIDVRGDGSLNVEGSKLRWERSMVSGRGVAELGNVEVSPADGRDAELIISGESHVIIRDSDVSGLRIVLIDSSTVEINDSLFDMEYIENRGAGDIIIDGESIPLPE